MNFSSKLIFIMNITQTSNKQLANSMNVDPSLISLFRNNKRGVPKNKNYIQAMGKYFAKKCVSVHQKSALAEAMGNNLIRENIDTETFAEIIGSWLIDNNNLGIDILFKRVNLKSDILIGDIAEENCKKSKTNINKQLGFAAYYGSDGKRKAFLDFLDCLVSESSNPLTLYVFSDENVDWFFEDSEFQKQVWSQFNIIYEGNFICKQIIPSISSVNEAFSQVAQWLPAYLSGKVESYYYPRLRDNIYCRTLLVVPNVAALASNSIGIDSKPHMTTLAFDKSMINAYFQEFNDYLSKCRPLIKTYQNEKAEEFMIDKLINFHSKDGPQCYVSPILSPLSTPEEIIQEVYSNDTVTLNKLLKIQKMFELSLKNDKTIEIFPIMTVEDVISKKYEIAISHWKDTQQQYTLKAYRQHLDRILYLLEHYENYEVIIIPKETPIVPMMLKEERSAILIRNEEPFTVFEMTHLQMILACKEYLKQYINKNTPPEYVNRETVMLIIKNLIDEFNEILSK